MGGQSLLSIFAIPCFRACKVRLLSGWLGTIRVSRCKAKRSAGVTGFIEYELMTYSAPSLPVDTATLAAVIDHALLSPTLDATTLDAECRYGRKQHVASVCVRPCDLRRAAEILADSRTAASTVVGFPHGGNSRSVKVYEAREAMEDGYSVLSNRQRPVELDMVVNIGRVITGDWGQVRDEVRAVREATWNRNCLLKIIFETGYLNADQIRRLCEICSEQECDFVKTGTGFGPRGASVDDVELMRRSSAAGVQIKASGGIRTLADAEKLLVAGATRLGTSSTKAILDECHDKYGA